MVIGVAAGMADVMVIPGTKAWDDAAGVLIVREAGGVVKDFAGDDWVLDSSEIIAGNSVIVEEGVRLFGA